MKVAERLQKGFSKVVAGAEYWKFENTEFYRVDNTVEIFHRHRMLSSYKIAKKKWSIANTLLIKATIKQGAVLSAIGCPVEHVGGKLEISTK